MNNYNKKWGLLIVLSIIWGSSFILIKKGLDQLSPIHLGSLRIIFTSLVIFVFSYKSLITIKKEKWKWIIITAYVGTFFPVYLVGFGQTELDSGLASILTTLTPMSTLVVGIFFFNLFFTKKQIVGLSIGLIGTFMLLYEGSLNSETNIFFAIFIVITTIGYGASVNLIKTHLTDIPPTAVTAGIFLSILPPAVLILIFSDFSSLNFSNNQVISSILYILVLAIFSSAIAQTLFNVFVKIASPLFASSVTYTMPVVAILWAVLDGEELTLIQYFASVIILFGVYLVNQKEKIT
jgi:drug/metabolite transporter (DMT)-like permease|tara:strand:- start:1444 stop:2322 length:879 start_codon:yes stop_codon:yes gene_type:complete